MKLLLIAIQAGLLVAGCGGKNPADGVGLAVLPSKVIIGPGPIRTCSDLQQSPLPAATAQGPLIVYPKLRIDWTSATHFLLISTIRVTVSGRGIRDGSYTYMVTSEELENLLGGPELEPNTLVDISNRTETDPRGKSRNKAPCQLLIPAVALASGNATPSFQARVKIEVIGTALNADYTDQYFVRQFIINKADYIKY